MTDDERDERIINYALAYVAGERLTDLYNGLPGVDERWTLRDVENFRDAAKAILERRVA